jgi:mediator of RNA polymerase II transcription subunit 14
MVILGKAPVMDFSTFFAEFALTRYALDFRLMTEQRITILDASYSIFSTDTSASKPMHSSNSSSINGNGKNSSSSLSSSSSSTPSTVDSSVLLQPIPNFKEVVTKIVAGDRGNGVFSIDVGLVCGVDAVKRVGKALHDRLVLDPAKPSAVGEKSASS